MHGRRDRKKDWQSECWRLWLYEHATGLVYVVGFCQKVCDLLLECIEIVVVKVSGLPQATRYNQAAFVILWHRRNLGVVQVRIPDKLQISASSNLQCHVCMLRNLWREFKVASADFVLAVELFSESPEQLPSCRISNDGELLKALGGLGGVILPKHAALRMPCEVRTFEFEVVRPMSAFKNGMAVVGVVLTCTPSVRVLEAHECGLTVSVKFDEKSSKT